MRSLIKLGLTLSFVLIFFAGNSQMLTSYIAPGHTYLSVTTDYTLTNTTAAYWYILSNQRYYTAQTTVIVLDSAGGDHTNVAVQLAGRVSGQLGWTNIGSAVNWTGTTADTVITITNATENLFIQFKLLFTGTGTGVTTISNLEFKQYLGLP